MYSNRYTATKYCPHCHRMTEHVRDVNHAVILATALTVFSCGCLLPIAIPLFLYQVSKAKEHCQVCRSPN
ncbi:MAG: LITAF-like zinc ribbon domain-containing protein [Aureliella sp.]